MVPDNSLTSNASLILYLYRLREVLVVFKSSSDVGQLHFNFFSEKYFSKSERALSKQAKNTYLPPLKWQEAK